MNQEFYLNKLLDTETELRDLKKKLRSMNFSNIFNRLLVILAIGAMMFYIIELEEQLYMTHMLLDQLMYDLNGAFIITPEQIPPGATEITISINIEGETIGEITHELETF